MARPKKPLAETYERIKEASIERNREASRQSRDIGPIPPVANPERRAEGEGSFRRWCEIYFPETFTLEWSPDHLRVIEMIEQVVTHALMFAIAMPRGSGKTSLCEKAVLWAAMGGMHKYIYLIGATEDKAKQMLDNLKAELSSNQRLLEDFPEVCFPIHSLQGESRRCMGQICEGEKTNIGWGADQIIFPTIPGSISSECVITVTGITGNIRGAKHTRSDGKSVRPTLAVIDDPQTDATAASNTDTNKRLKVLNGAIMGLAGPGKRMAAIVPCTVIQEGDLADQILNRETNPQWQGDRCRMVYEFPDNEALWEEYAEIRREGFRGGDRGAAATEFYRQHREEMDRGARVAWEARHDPDELSGLQHAMNLKIRNEAAFFAEYQNEPMPMEETESTMMSADEISAKVNNLDRNAVPVGCEWVTAFIDVQGDVLFWMVAAWTQDFTGYVLDYGTFPEQRKRYFSLRDLSPSLSEVYPNAGEEGRIFAGLKSLSDELLSRTWQRDDGTDMRLDRLLIDAGYKGDTVFQAVRQSAHAARITPSLGRSITASNVPMEEYHKRAGERLGFHWLLRPNTSRTMRHLLIDVNFWKTFVHARLGVSMGDAGCLSLYGSKPANHRLLADHLISEYRIRTEGRGRSLEEWKLLPSKPDNHWFDCMVGVAAAASICGASLDAAKAFAPEPSGKKRMTLSEIQARKRLGA
jgi:hypothetical protein